MMKMSILGLAVSTLFVVGGAQAGTNSSDVSATLTVSGTVTASQSACSITLGQTSIALNADVSNLVIQGASTTPANSVDMVIDGDDQCKTLASEGKMAFKFLGVADNAQGSSLANTVDGDAAAKGIGIALYDNEGTVLHINRDTMAASSTATHLGLGLVKLDGQEAIAGSVQGALVIQIERL